MVTNNLSFKTLQEAWEGINMYFATHEKEIFANGGGIYGTEFLSMHNMINVETAWVDPKFDFGEVLGYNIKKWTTLLKNYVDFNYLDKLKSEIYVREKKRSKNYNYSFHFSNKYGGGKDCLLSLTFSKMIGNPKPQVFFNVRISEVTCRLIFDFLLVQRICEYVYGKGREVEVHFHAPSMYVTAERFTMFAHYKGWDNIKPLLDPTKRFQNRILKTYDLFSKKDVETINYKAHRRNAEVIQGVKPAVSMKAKTLIMHKNLTKLPEDVITQRQIKNYIKQVSNEKI